MPGRPVDEKTRGEIVAAAKGGVTRNQIARDFGVAGDTVTRICADAGVTFDRTQTEIAVKARQIDLAEARLLLVQTMAIEAQEELELLNAPYFVYNFGGKDNTFQSEVLDSAPIDVRRSVMTNAGIVFDKLTRIVEKSNPGLEVAEGILDQAASFFEAAAAKIREAEPETPDANGA